MKVKFYSLFLGITLTIFLLFCGCTISTTSTTSYASNGYYQIDGTDFLDSPIYPKIHLEITNRGDTNGKDVQQKLIFTMKGRKIHEETVYYGDIPAGSMRSKDIVVELNLGGSELEELKKNSKLLDWEYAETIDNGKVIKDS